MKKLPRTLALAIRVLIACTLGGCTYENMCADEMQCRDGNDADVDACVIGYEQNEDLADLYGEFQALGAEIYAVSTDTHFSHKAWHDTSPAIGKIDYYMLGDQNHVLANNFDVLRPGVGLADRGTFVVDPQGVIQLVEITPEGVGRNAAELLRKLKALKYWQTHPGEVCPAKWEEGEKTLAPSLDLVGKI